MPQRPTLSVVTPMLNAAATIGEAVSSVLSGVGTRLGVEVLLVDDGSTDETARLAAGYARSDQRVRFFDVRARAALGDVGRGAGPARTFGMEQARGAYVLFMDADDAVEPDGPDRLVDMADGEARAGRSACACGRLRVCDQALRPLGRTHGPQGDFITEQSFLTGNALTTGVQHVIAAELLRGRVFEPSLRVAQDWDLWMRMAESGVTWRALSGPPVGRYRVRPNSLTKDFALMAADGIGVLEAHVARRGRDAAAVVSFRRMVALEAATRGALVGVKPEACVETALGIDPGCRGWTAGEMARECANGVVLALGWAPDNKGEEQDVWLGRVRSFWATLEKRGLSLERERTWACLAGCMIDHGAVACEVLSTARTAGTGAAPVVVGLGKSGGTLLDHAASCGHEVLAYDDDPERRGMWGTVVTAGDWEAVRASRGALVVSAEADESLQARVLGLGRPVFRWSEAVERYQIGVERGLREWLAAHDESRAAIPV